MKKVLLNKLMMFKAVLALLKANIALWSTIPDLVSDVGEFEELVGNIDETRQQIGEELSGQTDQKEAAREKLTDKTMSLSSVLAAMAERTTTEVLLAKVDFSKSDFERLRENEQVSKANEIALLTEENLEALASSGITDADITELKELSTNFEQYLPLKRVSVSERKAANSLIKVEFRAANRLLKKRIDRMLVRYETTNPDFYASYQNARLIVDYGIRHEHEEETPSEPAQPS